MQLALIISTAMVVIYLGVRLKRGQSIPLEGAVTCFFNPCGLVTNALLLWKVLSSHGQPMVLTDAEVMFIAFGFLAFFWSAAVSIPEAFKK